MADVTIKYKDSVIAEMDNGKATKTLNTSGCYCEGDVKIDYTPKFKTYEITLAKSSGWIFLVNLDSEVLEHINDEQLVVTLINTDTYQYVSSYSGNCYLVKNNPNGYNGNYPVYGYSNRINSATSIAQDVIYYPANNTTKSTNLGGKATFWLDSGKYYMQPSDGFITAGTYRLTFMW